MTVLVLVVAGMLAFGLPRLSPRGGRRFWHSWIDNGLLPLLLGLLAARSIGGDQAQARPDQLVDAIRALLALGLATAGVLVGTQFRIVFVLRAGRTFLLRHSRRALLVALPILVAVTTLLGIVGHEAGAALALACLLAGLGLATSQRPPVSAYAFNVRDRDIVDLHIAPSGWWNLLALLLASGGLQFGLAGQRSLIHDLLPGSVAGLLPGWLLGPLLAVAAGLGLGWLVKGARNRSEAALFLLAVLGLAGGLALLLDGSPLFIGILVGACFVNVALGRLGMIERLLIDLEQPVVIAAGLLGGLLIGFGLGSGSGWLGGGSPTAYDAAVVLLLVARPLLRLRWSPSHDSLSTRAERACAAPGATGILLLACLPLAPSPVIALGAGVIWVLLVLNGLSEWLDWRLLGRGRTDRGETTWEPASEPV